MRVHTCVLETRCRLVFQLDAMVLVEKGLVEKSAEISSEKSPEISP